jgi:hypothetical protein
VGLHIHVRCTCIADGLAAPHPNPNLLRFDENGDPYLDWEQAKPEQWESHERWIKSGCPHEDGYLLFKHLGNIGSIAHVRAHISTQTKTHFPFMMAKVIYSGTHCGDSIPTTDAEVLLTESKLLLDGTLDPDVRRFAFDLIDVCLASLKTGNPIVF